MVSHFVKELKAKGWKQREIAEKIGVTQEFISRLSGGANCSLETAIKLADAFETTLDTVIGRRAPEKELTRVEELLLEVTNGDDEIARAALRCAEGEKLIKSIGTKGRARAA